MSLPSIPQVAADLKIDLSKARKSQRERVLVEAMRRDLPLAVELLHQKSHKKGVEAEWLEDPNSEVGKQLIRLHASDALRPLAEKHFCHGKKLWFVNCCKGTVGTKPRNLLKLQIETQMGPIAYADC